MSIDFYDYECQPARAKLESVYEDRYCGRCGRKMKNGY